LKTRANAELSARPKRGGAKNMVDTEIRVYAFNYLFIVPIFSLFIKILQKPPQKKFKNYKSKSFS